jgi:hypothetical protein
VWTKKKKNKLFKPWSQSKDILKYWDVPDSTASVLKYLPFSHIIAYIEGRTHTSIIDTVLPILKSTGTLLAPSQQL